MKASIKCLAVLSHAVKPFAVIVARFRKGPTYVYLDFDDRAALGDLWRQQRGDRAAPQSYVEAFPVLVRGHAIDPESGNVFEDELSIRSGMWHSGEGLWVRSDVATDALAALAKWRAESHPREGAIAAPSWRVLTAVRALALAANLPDPGVNTPAGPTGYKEDRDLVSFLID